MPDVSRDRSRTDETGRKSPECVEHDFERDWDGDGPGVPNNDDIKNAAQMERLGDDDKGENDALGG